MASAQQLIGLVKSHAEGDEGRFFDLAMQLASTEDQKGHRRLADQIRLWAEAGVAPETTPNRRPLVLAAPKGDLAELIAATYPATRLSELVLPEDTRSELAQIVVETRQRTRLEERGLQPRRRMLLTGPPGTGKTMTAAALAGELKFPMFSVLLHGLITKFFGETASKLRAVFDAIRTTRGVYLFDEIDALAGDRTRAGDIGEARRVLNSFLQFLEEDPGPSLIVATTNLPKLLDAAILRRFDLVLTYELPSSNLVADTVRRRLRNFPTKEVDWNRIANEGRGFSPADLIRATEDAARRLVLAGQDEVSTSDLLLAFGRRRNLQSISDGDGTPKSSSPIRSRARRIGAVPARKHRTPKTPQ